jgi:hypothetical protein
VHDSSPSRAIPTTSCNTPTRSTPAPELREASPRSGELNAIPLDPVASRAMIGAVDSIKDDWDVRTRPARSLKPGSTSTGLQPAVHYN